jgi:hypothetical protein
VKGPKLADRHGFEIIRFHVLTQSLNLEVIVIERCFRVRANPWRFRAASVRRTGANSSDVSPGDQPADEQRIPPRGRRSQVPELTQSTCIKLNSRLPWRRRKRAVAWPARIFPQSGPSVTNPSASYCAWRLRFHRIAEHADASGNPSTSRYRAARYRSHPN